MSAWPTDRDPFEADRHAIARLLQARGESHAAAIVALSVYRPDHVDNWDGGQYEASLEVPPEFYDQVAGGEFAAAISQAAEAVIGPGHYAGLNTRVLAESPNPDWVEEVVASLRARRVASERADLDQAAITR
ncbi:hypothetical protein PP564_13030 [Mycobacteroides abscessus]|uniref:hypothetical protein n=1 Tax=Mycobacteroides abscessus TaxID=36809 RepID=UPI000C264D31|nr:hypothetical protein [Mycobacteroides abscessus]MDM2496026.1 hypothetical protein [Mycobacteroides abscessus]MDM2514615.1 hypothetical protein [Mycobacteroides abscessus]MDM2523597.1 hypothetical protein [Mycobacteroides abscessus]MDM2529776.1 hypothetical protein [Mycobacteroides abscessus]MDM2531371.1 hypothetical protein [Mycobacteroides abscessus]